MQGLNSLTEMTPIKFPFRFTKNKDRNDIINSFANIEFIRSEFNVLNTINDIDRLIILANEMNMLHDFVMREETILYTPVNLFECDYKKIENQCKNICPIYYTNVPQIKDTEFINGYQLYDCVTLFPYYMYYSWLRLWNKNDANLEETTFLELYYNTACTRWSKMDSNGNNFGCFWDLPKYTNEYKNAYFLTREKNGKLLWNLPFPKYFILETVNIGCNNLMDSVRYSNFLCEWMKRKINTMI